MGNKNVAAPVMDPLGLDLLDVARFLRRRFDQCLEQAGLGLTASEARALWLVSRKPDLPQSVLAEELSIEPMTLIGFLDRLETLGLIERVREPNDRRMKRIRVTEAAADFVVRIARISRSVREESEQGIDAATIESLRQAMLEMRENIQRNDKVSA